MFCRMACVLVVFGFGLGIAAGEELRGKIVKLDEKKLSFQARNPETKKFEDAKDYELSKDVKVSKFESKKTKIDVSEGLKTEALSKLSSEGVQATIVLSDGKVTEIILRGKKKKKSD